MLLLSFLQCFCRYCCCCYNVAIFAVVVAVIVVVAVVVLIVMLLLMLLLFPLFLLWLLLHCCCCLDAVNYTRKNAQVVTRLQTSCYKSVHKLLKVVFALLCSYLLFGTKFGTNC